MGRDASDPRTSSSAVGLCAGTLSYLTIADYRAGLRGGQLGRGRRAHLTFARSRNSLCHGCMVATLERSGRDDRTLAVSLGCKGGSQLSHLYRCDDSIWSVGPRLAMSASLTGHLRRSPPQDSRGKPARAGHSKLSHLYRCDDSIWSVGPQQFMAAHRTGIQRRSHHHACVRLRLRPGHREDG